MNKIIYYLNKLIVRIYWHTPCPAHCRQLSTNTTRHCLRTKQLEIVATAKSWSCMQLSTNTTNHYLHTKQLEIVTTVMPARAGKYLQLIHIRRVVNATTICTQSGYVDSGKRHVPQMQATIYHLEPNIIIQPSGNGQGWNERVCLVKLIDEPHGSSGFEMPDDHPWSQLDMDYQTATRSQNHSVGRFSLNSQTRIVPVSLSGRRGL